MSTTAAPLNPALVQQFDDACMDAVRIGKRLRYGADIYLQMRAQHGPVKAAILLADGKFHYGFTTLFELGHPALTLEAIIHDNPQFHPLFPSPTTTIKNADDILRETGYIP